MLRCLHTAATSSSRGRVRLYTVRPYIGVAITGTVVSATTAHNPLQEHTKETYLDARQEPEQAAEHCDEKYLADGDE